jgi:N-acetylglucosaminyldiphosphoundecaprenol N-acetyl-beta-D-mannosaminyltransferase
MTARENQNGTNACRGVPDDLAREVYCICGIPVDAIGMRSCLRRIEAAADGGVPFLVSTPNLNFLLNSSLDREFRESLLESDLCPPDGMPVVWLARLFGIPIRKRVAGSDIFNALKVRKRKQPLKLFLFGGVDGVAAAASRALNAQHCGFKCVGTLSPGFGSVDSMSGQAIIDQINSSDADFLVVSLGAKKGQLWLRRNRQRLRAPIQAHLGAVINFEAAIVSRAPSIMRASGLEWIWRIKEEPHLWQRYCRDSMFLIRLLLSRSVPLAVWTWQLRLRQAYASRDLLVKRSHSHDCVTVALVGAAIAQCVDKIAVVFREAIAAETTVSIDFSNTSMVDARFLGLLLMLRKKLKTADLNLVLTGLSSELGMLFRLHGLEYLLPDDQYSISAPMSEPPTKSVSTMRR